MAVNVAFASPVNLPGQEPVLSAADVWNGIVATVKRPEDFVDYLSETEILEEKRLTLRRILHFRPGGTHNAPGGKLDQFVTIIPEHKVSYNEVSARCSLDSFFFFSSFFFSGFGWKLAFG